MSNKILNSLLREYEQKKINAEIDLERRKENLYKLIPRLEEIDNQLNNYAINTAKNILNSENINDKELNDFKIKMENLKKERESILLQNNYSLDYLKPFYECNICSDTGYITDDNYKTVMCSCLKQKLLDISFNKSNISNLQKENFNNFDELIFSDDVDLAKYKYNISPRKNILNIKNKCVEFIENFENPEYKNLLFTGPTGLR